MLKVNTILPSHFLFKLLKRKIKGILKMKYDILWLFAIKMLSILLGVTKCSTVPVGVHLWWGLHDGNVMAMYGGSVLGAATYGMKEEPVVRMSSAELAIAIEWDTFLHSWSSLRYTSSHFEIGVSVKGFHIMNCHLMQKLVLSLKNAKNNIILWP